MADWTAAVASFLALSFTLYSFWWMYWREGKLSVGDLQHFAAGKAIAADDGSSALFVGLPLVIFNIGASPIVLESLRLRARSKGLPTLLYQGVEEPLWAQDPSGITRDQFFLPCIVRANDVIKNNFVFTASRVVVDLENLLYCFDLEAKFSNRRAWQRLKVIELDMRDQDRFSRYKLNSYYLVYPYRRGERA